MVCTKGKSILQMIMALRERAESEKQEGREAEEIDIQQTV